MGAFSLNQVKVDFENMKKRVILAQAMKAQGYSENEVLEALEKTRKPDMVDLLVMEFENSI